MIRFKSWLPLVVALPAFLAGCSEDTKPEETHPAPVVDYFIAEPNPIDLEMFSTLAWGTREADKVRIDVLGGGPVDLGKEKAGAGTVDVFPSAPTVYVLTATGPGGTATASVLVQLNKPGRPQVTLSSNPADVTFGGSATLTWTVKNATRARLFAGENPEPIVDETEKTQGTLTISPTVPTLYRLIAEGEGGRSVAELPVGIVAGIESFGPTSAGPAALGQMVELGWKTRGAQKLVVSNDDGFEQVIAAGLDEGTIDVPVGAGGTFRLVATRGTKETVATAKVDVMALPLVETFDADKPFVTDATEADPVQVTLFWDASEATTMTLTAEPGGEIDLDDDALSAGSITVDVTGTTTFTLVASNPVGSDSRTLTVTNLPSPAIVSFDADLLAVDPGDEVTLSWEFEHGRADLLKNEGDGWERIFFGTLPTTGTITVAVDVDTDFVLRVTNGAGTFVEEAISVTVNLPE